MNVVNPPKTKVMNAPDSRVLTSCAGSGKTTALVGRLMELLAHGVCPGEILMITFTNKAAAEIRARLLEALQTRAQTDEKFAKVRRQILLAAEANDSPAVFTFHSWFLTLLRHRPGGFFHPPNVCNSHESAFDEAWRRWQKRAEQEPSDALCTVLTEITPLSLRKLCEQFIERRAAYSLLPPQTDDRFNLKEELQTQAAAAYQAAKQFAENAKGDGKTFDAAKQAAERIATGADISENEIKCFFTAQDTVNKNLQKNADKNGYISLLQTLADALLSFATLSDEYRAQMFNDAALTVCEDFNLEWQAVLDSRNEVTFNDLELQTCRMMEDNIYADLSQRLSAKYRHILIDEFQDTSPMQWRIVRKWLLDAHGPDAPSVFIVGDPKQAIYGFRHGDSRLLEEAKKFLEEHYQARPSEEKSVCYRCAENILRAVNTVFDSPHRMPGFHAHTTGKQPPGGRVEWHAVQTEAKPKSKKRFYDPVRDPLRHPPPAAAPTEQHRARQVADKTKEILQTWQVTDKDGTSRQCRPEDILILMPQKTHEEEVLSALAANNIPCAAQTGGFLRSFECADVLDLLSVLTSPGRDYSLARVLKSPLFSLSDDALTDIACSKGDKFTLWDKLQQHRGKESRRARVMLRWWQRRVSQTLLPAHDFLSKIFAQGRIIARYRAAVLPPLRDRVSDNLSRLLDLSLQLDGGVRPLLSQFLQETRRREKFDTQPASGGVRLMSIHAAKGLESPIVILTNTDFTRTGGRGDSTDIYVDWPPSADHPQNFIISLRNCRRAFATLKQQEKEKEVRETANLLYVAMTRAARALIIFSSPEPKDGPSLWLLEAMKRFGTHKSETNSFIFGDDLQTSDHASQPKPPLPAPGKEVIGRRKSGGDAHAARGEIRHRLAALLLSGASDQTVRQLAFAEDRQRREAEIMTRSPQLQTLLADAAEVLSERDFALDGKIIRPDLVIIRKDAVWIVDHKTGAQNPQKHLTQLQLYRQAVSVQYSSLPIHLAVLDVGGKLHVLKE